MIEFTKVINPGSGETCGGRRFQTYCEIKYKEGGRLSITGVEGPLKNGDCLGGCGQINLRCITKFASGWDAERLGAFMDTWQRWHLNDMQAGCEHQRKAWDTGEELEVIEYTWSKTFYASRRAAENGTLDAEQYLIYKELVKKVDSIVIRSINHGEEYPAELIKELLVGSHIKEQSRERKQAGWVHPDEHPKGLLCKPCPECGYSYGSAWLFEEVPTEVLEYLQALPDSVATPAWV